MGKAPFTNLVGDGLEQLMMPVGIVTCNGFVKSELVSLLNDQCSVSNVKSVAGKQFDNLRKMRKKIC